MSISELEGPVTLARLSGRLDAAGADTIAVRFTAAVAAQGRHAVIDLSQVTFIASMGMRLLVSAARALNQKGCRLAAFGASDNVLAAITDAALDQIIPCSATQDEALAGLLA